MSSIISATTKSVAGARTRASRRDRFLDSAHVLLAQARKEERQGSFDLALESAYRAALRVAGAVNADSDVIRARKRLPTSAWDRLALTSPGGKEWARGFLAYSKQRARVASGIETRPDPDRVRTLISMAERFFAESIPGANVAEVAA